MRGENDIIPMRTKRFELEYSQYREHTMGSFDEDSPMDLRKKPALNRQNENSSPLTNNNGHGTHTDHSQVDYAESEWLKRWHRLSSTAGPNPFLNSMFYLKNEDMMRRLTGTISNSETQLPGYPSMASPFLMNPLAFSNLGPLLCDQFGVTYALIKSSDGAHIPVPINQSVYGMANRQAQEIEDDDDSNIPEEKLSNTSEDKSYYHNRREQNSQSEKENLNFSKNYSQKNGCILPKHRWLSASQLEESSRLANNIRSNSNIGSVHYDSSLERQSPASSDCRLTNEVPSMKNSPLRKQLNEKIAVYKFVKKASSSFLRRRSLSFSNIYAKKHQEKNKMVRSRNSGYHSDGEVDIRISEPNSWQNLPFSSRNVTASKSKRKIKEFSDTDDEMDEESEPEPFHKSQSQILNYSATKLNESKRMRACRSLSDTSLRYKDFFPSNVPADLTMKFNSASMEAQAISKSQEHETFLQRLRHMAPVGFPWNVYGYYTHLMHKFQDHEVLKHHLGIDRSAVPGTEISSPPTSPSPIQSSIARLYQSDQRQSDGAHEEGILGDLNLKKRPVRALTGKHVKHGTGASPSTLLTLRQKIQERQKAKELGLSGNNSISRSSSCPQRRLSPSAKCPKKERCKVIPTIKSPISLTCGKDGPTT